MKRREFIGLAGGAVAWPLAARAQRRDKPVIGLLAQGTSSAWNLTGFRQGLRDAGYIEGQNLAIEYRFANDDPVKQGHVTSLNHPGGNVTGSISLANELFGKQIGILHELVPQATHLGVLSHPKGILHESIVKETQTAASALGLTVEMVDAGSSGEIDTAFARLGNEKRVQALLVANDPLYVAQRVQIVALAARHAIPTIYPFREIADSGGLLSYGANIAERDRQAGLYVGRILKRIQPNCRSCR
jgi:putative tryptophan/tyrosine transport system substrate-binding protein